MLNEKGRSPLHVLARFTERNTTDIFNVFMETMPEYPIDKQDTEGKRYIKCVHGDCAGISYR